MNTVKRSATRIIRCIHCNRILSQQVGDTVKIRVPSRTIAFKSLDSGDPVAEIRCPHCGADTPLLPIRLQGVVALKP